MPALPWTTRTTPDPEAAYVVMGSKLPLWGYRRMGQSKFVFWTCRGGDTPIQWDTVARHLDQPAE
jgi:hypothetical protein